ncbi:hypothetical protein LMED105_16063 [Limnobacter sp. MED105]|nr:hypothetical protein LMED105_16063 [Limnobacter sp. MED105]
MPHRFKLMVQKITQVTRPLGISGFQAESFFYAVDVIAKDVDPARGLANSGGHSHDRIPNRIHGLK